jgi:hypothetical protein
MSKAENVEKPSDFEVLVGRCAPQIPRVAEPSLEEVIPCIAPQHCLDDVSSAWRLILAPQ